MLKRKMIHSLSIALLGSVLISCGGGGSSSDNSADNNGNSQGAGSSSATQIAQVSTGDQAVFLARSSSSSDVMNIGGQTVTLESGSGYLYRYVPSIPALERFDSTYNATNNYSCNSAGAQKPYTSGQALFNIEVCPNYSGGYSLVDVEQVNTATGELLGYSCNLILSGTSQVSIEIMYLGGYLYYVDSSGDLLRGLPNCSTPSTILSAGDSNNTGTFYGIAGQLISVYDDVFYNDRYILRRHNLDNGTITGSLIEITTTDSKEEFWFFEGDDALYWAVYHRDNYTLDFYRYVPDGSVQNIYSTTLSDAKTGIAIDASGGEVLISYKYVASRDTNGYATSWTQVTWIYDVAGDTLSDLDLNNNFESSIQYLIY